VLARNISVDGCTTVGGTNLSACIVINMEKVETRVSEGIVPPEIDVVDTMDVKYFEKQLGLTLLEWEFDFRLILIFSPRNSGEFIEVCYSLFVDIIFPVVLYIFILAFYFVHFSISVLMLRNFPSLGNTKKDH